MVNADKELSEKKFAHLKSGAPSDLLDFVVKTAKLGNVVTAVHLSIAWPIL